LARLKDVIETAQAQQKMTGITAWRNVWLEKNKKNQFVFKDTARHKKILAASLVYNDYLNAMQEASLYDYDDMILRLVHALEVFPDLKFNLQEQYQYILVDEFQDTNGAQMRILLSLTDNPVVGDKPNILVVGDDDQAIYSFQGAELSNLLSFQRRFDPEIVNLRENYRSAPSILQQARDIITQSAARLETTLQGVDKTPLPQVKDIGSRVELIETVSTQGEYNMVAEMIKKRIKNGQKPSNIAVLARNHADIQSLLPFFNHHKIDFSYEHQDDILQTAPIKTLVELARIIVWLGEGRHDKVDAHLPELLAHPAWGCTPPDLWQLSLKAYATRKTWLEIMRETDGRLKDIAAFIIETSYNLNQWSFEDTIDRLYGMAQPDEEGYISPLGEYFFPRTREPKNARELIQNIHSLNHLRRLLKEYRPNSPLALKDFVEFVDSLEAAHIRLTLHSDAEPDESAVSIMTAHKAKGREFESVFIVNASDERWGSKSRSRPSRLSYPANLPIAPPGTTEDERLRLFFVAMTRAKRELIISYASHNDAGKPQLKADFLHADTRQAQATLADTASLEEQQKIAEISWRNAVSQPTPDLKTALRPMLKDYRLSATHLNSFLDVARGGPRNFLVHNLLRFPISLPPQAALGSAIHTTLKNTHDHFSATKERKPLEDVLYDFETNLRTERLAKKDFVYQLQKGSDALQSYLQTAYDTFSPSQIGERNFYHQNIIINGVNITGIIDVMDVNQTDKTITISDYKTGKPSHGWNGKSDYEKIKLHHYKQQLMFYKLLIEASPDFRGYTVHKGILEFIEPDESGELVRLEIDYDNEDIETFKKLILSVWSQIIKADFIDTSGYPQNYKGILAFEKHLLEG
jgi:DNA helicase-2/ATP-dependent DNA helicase PcrA